MLLFRYVVAIYNKRPTFATTYGKIIRLGVS